MSPDHAVRVGGQEVANAPDGGNLLLALRRAGMRSPRWLFPWSCRGRGRCRGCRVRVLGGDLSLTTPHEVAQLTRAEREAGVRLACQALVLGPVELRPEGVTRGR